MTKNKCPILWEVVVHITTWKKKTVAHGSGNAHCDLYSCSKEMFNLAFIYDTCYRKCLTWRPSMATHPSALRQLFYTSVSIQYLFPRCLPCLSRRRTHNQMSSATMDKCTDFRKYAFPDPCLFTFFLFWWVLPSLKIFNTFLTPCLMWSRYCKYKFWTLIISRVAKGDCDFQISDLVKNSDGTDI